MEASFSALSLVVLLLLQLSSRAIACEQNATRLVNGQSKFEGLVEVCDSGEWRTICSDAWDEREATVVCRQIGFAGNLNASAVVGFRLGVGSGRITETRWECSGVESALSDCPRHNNSCTNDSAAGVACFGATENCTEGEIRLANGNLLEGSGRVEVCLDGHWGTVCDDGWDINDATTVCRQLGYSEFEKAIPTRRAYFGEGDGPIHISRAQCRSNHTRLIECSANDTGINECMHREDAGVICNGSSNCTDGSVRLANGSSEREGRVEFCYSGVWGTVCDRDWDGVAASIVCTQLGYGQPGTPTTHSRFGPGLGPVLLDGVACNASYTQLSQCTHPLSIGIHECSKDRIAGVTCPEVISFSAITTSNTIIIKNTLVSITASPTLKMDIMTANRVKSIDINGGDVSTHQTRADDSTSTTPATISISSIPQAIIFGAVGGALAVGVVIVATILLAMVVVRRKGKAVENGSKKPHYYDEVEISASPVDKKSPGNSSSPNTIKPPTIFEALYTETTLISDSSDDMQTNSVPAVLPSEGERNYYNDQVHNYYRGEQRNGTASEATYDDIVPRAMDSVQNDNNCYSSLGPIDYSILQPHIPKPTPQQLPPTDDQYSCLQHV